MEKLNLNLIILSFFTLFLQIMAANAQIVCTIDNMNSYAVIPTLRSDRQIFQKDLGNI